MKKHVQFLDQEHLIDVPIIGHEVLVDEPLINWVSLGVGLLQIVVEGGSHHRSHLRKKLEHGARPLHLDDDFVIISSILLSVHLSDVEPLDVVELDLGDVGHIDDGRPLLLGRLKLLGPLGECLLLPLELLVSSFLVVMKNIVHQAELYLNFVELDVVILNHCVLLL